MCNLKSSAVRDGTESEREGDGADGSERTERNVTEGREFFKLRAVDRGGFVSSRRG